VVLYVVMVAPECAPAAKAGGLGDVVSGLSRELELRGNAVALSRALRLRSDRPAEFRELVASCMRADYSWARPGQEYLDIYEHIRHK
jgi:glycogen synthase